MENMKAEYSSISPVVTVKTVMAKWDMNRKTAIKFMQIPHLHSYIGPNGTWCCERQYFDEVLEEMKKYRDYKDVLTMKDVISNSDNWLISELKDLDFLSEEIINFIMK